MGNNTRPAGFLRLTRACGFLCQNCGFRGGGAFSGQKIESMISDKDILKGFKFGHSSKVDDDGKVLSGFAGTYDIQIYKDFYLQFCL